MEHKYLLIEVGKDWKSITKEEYDKYPYTGGLSNFAFNEPIKKELESFCLINNKPNWTMNQIIDIKEIIPNFKAVIEYENTNTIEYVYSPQRTNYFVKKPE